MKKRMLLQEKKKESTRAVHLWHDRSHIALDPSLVFESHQWNLSQRISRYFKGDVVVYYIQFEAVFSCQSFPHYSNSGCACEKDGQEASLWSTPNNCVGPVHRISEQMIRRAYVTLKN